MPTIRCPVCKKQFDSEHSVAMPFCSDRCKQIDLTHWLDERYTLPVEQSEDAEGNGTAAEDD